MEKTMPIEHGVTQPRVPHPAVKTFVVSAFRQPDPQWAFPQEPVVFPHGRAQLGTNRFRMLTQQWQVAVGGTAGEQIEHALTLEGCEAANEIALALTPGPKMVLKTVGQMFCGDLAVCLLYTSPSPRDRQKSRMPSSA